MQFKVIFVCKAFGNVWKEFKKKDLGGGGIGTFSNDNPF